MKITSIKQQVKRTDRYSIYVDDKYSFSLSEGALLESGLSSGTDLTEGQVADYKKVSNDDKVYAQALRYVAMRPRSTGEMRDYLRRKKASPPLLDTILNKLSIVGLLDDFKFAEMFVHDRRLLRPTSRRKMQLELRKKHINDEIIQKALGSEREDETKALHALIERKRRQTKYQDNQKLMEYLARQGFAYGDIKTALSNNEEWLY